MTLEKRSQGTWVVRVEGRCAGILFRLLYPSLGVRLDCWEEVVVCLFLSSCLFNFANKRRFVSFLIMVSKKPESSVKTPGPVCLRIYHQRPDNCPLQFAGSRSTTAAISSSVYIRKPLSRVTLANWTFFASSFSSMTCFNVLRTNVSASARVRDCNFPSQCVENKHCEKPEKAKVTRTL
jgi:hypothetical protein